MYSCNIFGCKLFALRGQSERVFNAIHYFGRYLQVLLEVYSFSQLYNTSGTAGIVKQCQILMESEMFREKHNYSISLNPFKQLKTKWWMTWDGVRKLKAKKRPGKERQSLAKSKFEEFGSFGGSQSDCVSVIKSYGEEISKMRLTQLQELRLKVF